MLDAEPDARLWGTSFELRIVGVEGGVEGGLMFAVPVGVSARLGLAQEVVACGMCADCFESVVCEDVGADGEVDGVVGERGVDE